jgi:hypothetical protein
MGFIDRRESLGRIVAYDDHLLSLDNSEDAPQRCIPEHPAVEARYVFAQDPTKQRKAPFW